VLGKIRKDWKGGGYTPVEALEKKKRKRDSAAKSSVGLRGNCTNKTRTKKGERGCRETETGGEIRHGLDARKRQLSASRDRKNENVRKDRRKVVKPENGGRQKSQTLAKTHEVWREVKKSNG